MIGDPGMEALEASIAVLQGERRAELRLSAWPFEENDELACDRQRDPLAEIRLDERQRQIDPGGEAGRSPEGSISDEDRIGARAHRGKSACEFGTSPPMRNCSAAIEEAGSRQ